MSEGGGLVAALIAREGLPAAYADIVERVWAPLATDLARRHAAAGRPLLIGINGAQGSGKSTMCVFLEALLAERHGLKVATLSLDDLYLTHADRAALAVRAHALFAARGVPGTHDLALAAASITALLAGTGPVAIPRFDKARDDRRPRAEWPVVTAPLDLLLFEGWCIGATPEAESALATPVNDLEAGDDPEKAWRHTVNTALGSGYARLFARLDTLIMLRAPGFAPVAAWRKQQEARLRQRAGPAEGMDDAALDRFLQHYERLTRHMLRTLPAQADVIIDMDAERRITGWHGLTG